MKAVKTTVSIILVLALIGLSLALIVEKAGYYAGAGDGENTRIEKVEELPPIIDDVLSSVNLKQAKTVAKTARKHKSATIELDYDMESDVKSDNYSINIKMVGTEKWYVSTETEQMIALTKGTVKTIVTENNITQTVEFYVDADVYINAEGVYMKFNNFSSNQAVSLPMNVLDKWLDVSSLNAYGSSMNEMVVSLMNGNAKTLERCGTYIRNNLENGFEQIGDKYIMNEALRKQFIAEEIVFKTNNLEGIIEDLVYDEAECEFAVDLTNKEETSIELLGNTKFSSKIEGQKFNYDTKYTESLLIKNVDNTVIEFDDNVKIYDIEELMY